jgi:hypothetical protein
MKGKTYSYRICTATFGNHKKKRKPIPEQFFDFVATGRSAEKFA